MKHSDRLAAISIRTTEQVGNWAQRHLHSRSLLGCQRRLLTSLTVPAHRPLRRLRRLTWSRVKESPRSSNADSIRITTVEAGRSLARNHGPAF